MVLFLLTLPAEAFEIAKIKLEINGMYKISQKGLTKALVLKSYVTDVKIFPDYAEITARNQGTSYIYLWSGSEVSVYNLDVSIPKQVKKANHYFLNETSGNISSGRYSVNTSAGFNFEKKFNFQPQNNLTHTIFYKTPFLDGNFSIASVFLTGTKNFNELTDLSMESINLLYTNKNFAFQTGDLGTEWKNNNLLMKGFNFSYNNPGKANIKFSGGILEDSAKISLIGNTTKKLLSPSTNNIIASLSGNITPFSFLELSPIFTYKQNDLSNLGLKLKLNPFSGLSFNSDLQTDFLASIQSHNIIYHYDFPKTGEYIDTNFNYNLRQKGYTVGETENSENYFLSVRMKHRSDFMISGNYNSSSNIHTNIKNANLRLSHSFFNNSAELFGQADINVLNNEAENKFTFGSSFQTIYPFPFKSNLDFQEKRGFTSSENFNFNNEIGLFNTDNFQLNLNDSFNYRQDRGKKDLKSLNNNFSLNSVIDWNDFLSTNVSAGFNYNLDDENGNTYSLFSKMNNIIKFSNFYDINIQTNIIDNLTKNNIAFNSNVNFNYHFGQTSENKPTKADISGTVFDDTNGDGMMQQDEKPLENIKVFIKDKILISGKDGHFCFSDIEPGSYELNIDKKSLDSTMRITTSSTETIELNGKNQEFNFGINSRILVKGFVYSSKDKDKGLASIQINMDNLENSISEEDGSFSFQVIPGLHIFQVDYSSLPKNYKLVGKQSQNLEIKNNEENILEFIFSPVRTIKGIVHSPADTSKGIPGINLTVKFFDNENFLREETIKTDEDGEFSLTGLDKGTVEISSPKMKKTEKIVVPDKPFVYELKIPIK